MSAQLDLFRLPAKQMPAPIVDPLLGAVPWTVARNSSYQSFNGALAHSIIIKLCHETDGWVKSRTISRACKMYPQDLARLCRNMVRRGEIEDTYLYYGSSTPLEKDYRGFEFGYRLAGQAGAEQGAAA